MKRVWVAVFFCVFASLSAQDRSSIKLYVAPASGGSPAEREFFDVNIPMEIKGAHYTITESLEEASYLVGMTISENPDSNTSSLFTLSVTKVSSAVPLVELSWVYTEVEEMYEWNLYLIYNALSNIAMESPAAPEPIVVPDPWLRTHWLYIGLRGGGPFTRYYFQPISGDNNPAYSTGIGVEGGLVVELRLFRFLSFQVEGNYSFYEVFKAPGEIVQGRTDSFDTFTLNSFMFPLMLKMPLKFGRFTWSPYVGVYCTWAPWEMTKTSDDTGETDDVAVNPQLPLPLPLPLALSFTMGTDVGFIIGPGEVFVDLRFGRDLVSTAIGEEGPVYVKDRITVGLGYRFGLGGKKQAATDNKEQPAANNN